jgi:two-component system NarL family sensor kinase
VWVAIDVGGSASTATADGCAASRRCPSGRLDDLVVGKITGQSVVRVRLWTPDGRIVYSGDHRLLGRQFALGESEREVLRSGHVEAEVSDLGKPENALDRHLGQLLEVYLPSTPRGASCCCSRRTRSTARCPIARRGSSGTSAW